MGWGAPLQNFKIESIDSLQPGESAPKYTPTSCTHETLGEAKTKTKTKDTVTMVIALDS